MIKRRAAMLVISMALLQVSIAQAAVVVVEDTQGGCAAGYGLLGWTLIGINPSNFELSKYTDQNGITYPFVSLTENYVYQALLPCNTNSCVNQCSDIYDYYTTFDPPAPAGVWVRIYQTIRHWTLQQGTDTTQGGPRPRIYTPTDGGGVRGSYGSSAGWEASTASPAWDQFSLDPNGNLEYFPFVVDEAGVNGTLSIYGNEGLLWSQPLSNFEIGSLYVADIGAGTVIDPTSEVITIVLSSPDSGTSQVYFPDDLTSDDDSGTTDGPLPLWSLGALGAGLLGIAAKRRKKVA